MRRLANGRERDPLCSCQHGPAVHRAAGRCVFTSTCGCVIWSPVPYVYDEESHCPRCRVLEAELREMEHVAMQALPPTPIPQQRPPSAAERLTARQVRRPNGQFGSRTDIPNNRGGR